MDHSRVPGYLAAGLVGALVVLVAGGALAGTGLVTVRTGSTGSSPSAAAASGASAGAPSQASSSPAGAGSAAPGASGGPVPVLPATAPESVGSATAPVVVEIWADFQCPFCGLFTHGLEPTLLREFVVPGTARLVFRDFAFLGPESLTASVAARCAGQQGAFWSFHDLLFASQNGENQGTFSDALMTQMARYLQLDVPAFDTCVKDPSVAAAVEQSRAEGEALGIQGTPSLRIVGPKQTVLLGSMPTIPVLAATIDRMAHGLPAPTPAPTARPGASGTAAPAASGSTAPALPSVTPAASR